MKAVMMRAAGGPDVLEYVDVPKPVPGPGEVLIKTHAIGVGMVDVLIRSGAYRWMPPLPTSPGSDLAGVIESVGSGVTEIAAGNPVLLTARDLPVRGGCYTEFIAVPAAAVHRLPDHVQFAQAVALPNYQVASGILNDAARGSLVKTLFITGAAGGVGSALADLGKAMGYGVIGSVSGPQKAAFATSVGADHVINYRTQDVVSEVLKFTEGRGVDLVLDHVGGAKFNDNLKMLADFGLLISFNAFNGPPDSDLFAALRTESVRCVGVRCFSFHAYDHNPPARRRLMTDVINRLGAGQINPRIAATLPLSAAAEAHRMVEAGQGLGKIVLVPRAVA